MEGPLIVMGLFIAITALSGLFYKMSEWFRFHRRRFRRKGNGA